MVWVEGWADDGNATLRSLKQHSEEINAVSLLGVVLLAENSTIVKNDTLIEQQKNYQAEGFKVFVFLATENASIVNIRSVLSQPDSLAEQLMRLAADNGWDGYNVDFEPITDVEDPTNNPTLEDARMFANFLAKLSSRMRAIGKSVSVDIETIAGACRSSTHWPKNVGPCPWIREFYEMDLLGASGVDRIINMGSYTLNNTEYPLELWYPLQYVPAQRFAVGLCPQYWQQAKHMPSKAELDQRFDLIKAYGIQEIDFWVYRLEPELLEYWEPFWPYLKEFLSTP
eukprot:CAMPEP_0175912490 /NCGR_PEP_ID=MMETSP0108-20121206/8755_1 /TAXON_ID=195067 ORGANISM="Goniomonas pacifica, Strain CCMP1869" /NCGR_SAMPLE_ID=MMETSP0108 /ASSEMBLY_ACC=CAM_ASM_000204 /LENGTH=283 /DNA_ID=CAMNT_0017234807 /DNA_START=14 /DNA_END=865 /DNA_ORIENTATION=-